MYRRLMKIPPRHVLHRLVSQGRLLTRRISRFPYHPPSTMRHRMSPSSLQYALRDNNDMPSRLFGEIEDALIVSLSALEASQRKLLC